jgi:hypothetical protein
VRLSTRIVDATMGEPLPPLRYDVAAEAARALEGNLATCGLDLGDGNEEVCIRRTFELDVQTKRHRPDELHVLCNSKVEARATVRDVELRRRRGGRRRGV